MKYKVLITRIITETGYVEVEANSFDEARYKVYTAEKNSDIFEHLGTPRIDIKVWKNTDKPKDNTKSGAW